MHQIKRALRGLALGLSISGLNLLGMFLTLVVVGGLGDWSTSQFVGAFGVFEIATAFAFMFCPNIWRLPVIEAETGERTSVRLAWSVASIPHWAGGAKAIAGVAMFAVAARSEGVNLSTLGVIPLIIATGLFIIGASAIVARWGVARPDIDVLHILVRRPGHKEIRIPGISLSASTVQIILGAFTLPVVKVTPPSALYQPEIGPSSAFLGVMLAAAVVSLAGTTLVWHGRLARRAPAEQQRKAEEPA